ncbi:MAG: molecular chaperone TorD family protein [Actinomycetaceae bacterium]|nr:molecular chaperone TorD family protein [Actinomycetaceae bacterium]
MITPELLDRYAAAFTVLGRLHLHPADEPSRVAVYNMLMDWPLIVTEADSEDSRADGEAVADTQRGLGLLLRSKQLAETDEAVRRDQDLLYGITATAKVPPFESVHRGQDGLVFDTDTLEVRKQYARLGFRAPNFNHEPDDHLGLELDFLGRCCIAMLDALDGNDIPAAQSAWYIAQDFTRDHLLKWAPEIVGRAEEAATTCWVKGLQALTAGTMRAWANDVLPD